MFDPKEAIAAILNTVTTSFTMNQGATPDQAAAIGNAVEGIVKGISAAPQTIEQQFKKILADAIEQVNLICELPEDCRYNIQEELLSHPNIERLIQSFDPYQELQSCILEICEKSAICNTETLPITKITDTLVEHVYQAIMNDPSLTGASTLYLVHDMHKDVKKIKTQIPFITKIETTPSIAYELWEASRRDFLASCSKGGRFATLNIIQHLLPKGYIAEPNFHARRKKEDGTIEKVMDICRNSTENIAIIGNGGIGKTTFLHQLMSDEFFGDAFATNNFPMSGTDTVTYEEGRTIPFFIELNRCPEQIDTWYDDFLHKTNFITRYIGQMLENHQSMNSVSEYTLNQIERELQKKPDTGHPQYLLLLDGFNEVKSGKNHSIREYLSNEISELNKYANVRIITTSRETQAAYFATDFQNVRLIGLENDDIIDYLKECKKTETEIGIIMSCKPLVECLRIPLHLCMFSAEDATELLPETPGEIFYYFFHRNSSFYNIRSRAVDTRTNPLNSFQTAFILDFILPYIGWSFEREDCFSVNELQFENIIRESICCIQALCSEMRVVPYADFKYKASVILDTINSFYLQDEVDTKIIIDCIYGYLGIVYGYETNNGSFMERNRYAFGHHQFRDYFSAIWDVQMLNLLPCITEKQFLQKYKTQSKVISFYDFVNTCYWPYHKTEFISQILMEHRNRPQLNPITQNWFLPMPEIDEQKVLNRAIDSCRNLSARDIDVHYLLQNVLSAIIDGRKELSGLDLSMLNLEQCNFFNITCSRKGKSKVLAAKFDGSTLSQRSFEPIDHRDYVIEFVYHDNQCYTLDQAGCIKCWDILSGKLEYELLSENPVGLQDLSSTGYMKISSDGKWLAVKLQDSTASGMNVGVILFDLTTDNKKPQVIYPAVRHKALNYFTFTDDGNGILFICDYNTVYCHTMKDFSLVYKRKYDELLKHSQLYTKDMVSPIYAFTAEYNSYDWESWYTEDFEEEENEFSELSIPCLICRLSCESADTEILYSFTGMPETVPTAQYIPNYQSFLLFNYDNRQIEFFDCIEGRACTIYEELTLENDMPPDFIHLHPLHSNECYIMYPENSYLVDINPANGNGIIMKYPIGGVNKLLAESELESELSFKTAVAPYKNRFIVGNDSTVYEWNSDEDTLQLKYNIVFYSCTGLFNDLKRQQFILVHQYNGVTVFGGNPIKIQNSYTFNERDYYIGNCCYDEHSGLLAMSFVRSDHEKVVVMNLENGKLCTCFSTTKNSETIETLCFHDNCASLLITSQYRCIEFDISNNQTLCIVEANENERIVGGNYVGNDIEIAFTQDKQGVQPEVDTRCEFYKKETQHDQVNYVKSWYYVIPELTDELFEYFIFEHGDLGVPGVLDDADVQKYWITKGFFLKDIENNTPLPKLLCYEMQRGENVPVEKNILPLQMTYFRHSKALEYQYREKDSGVSYTYLNNDKAVFMRNSKMLFLHNNYTECTYNDIESGFQKELGSYGGHAYWDHAIPFEYSIIGCFENYRLLEMDANNGSEKCIIEYTPGLAIYGCSFKNTVCDDSLKEELSANGAIF